MTEPSARPEGCLSGNDAVIARRVALTSILLLLALTGGGWFLYDASFARSVFLGGLLAIASFWMLQNDIRALMRRVSARGEAAPSAARGEQIRFYIKFYARLSVSALLLFVLAVRMPLNVFGLLLGLGTITISVFIIGLSAGKSWMPNKI